MTQKTNTVINNETPSFPGDHETARLDRQLAQAAEHERLARKYDLMGRHSVRLLVEGVTEKSMWEASRHGGKHARRPESETDL